MRDAVKMSLVRQLYATPNDAPLYYVFSDWLEDRGHVAAGQRVRLLGHAHELADAVELKPKPAQVLWTTPADLLNRNFLALRQEQLTPPHLNRVVCTAYHLRWLTCLFGAWYVKYTTHAGSQKRISDVFLPQTRECLVRAEMYWAGVNTDKPTFVYHKAFDRLTMISADVSGGERLRVPVGESYDDVIFDPKREILQLSMVKHVRKCLLYERHDVSLTSSIQLVACAIAMRAIT